MRACGRLMFKSLTGCWPNIRLLNVSKVLHCKSYTSIIKVANLLLSLSPRRNLPVSSSLSSPFPQPRSVTTRLGFDELHKYHPNGKSASWYRHGTDSCLEGTRAQARAERRQSPSSFPASELKRSQSNNSRGGRREGKTEDGELKGKLKKVTRGK